MSDQPQPQAGAGAASPGVESPGVAPSAQPPSSPPPARESVKDTFESIAVALILAFVFRAFIVEAFVIPTGSMASTLMGRHYEVICDRCGYGPWPLGMPRDDAGNALGSQSSPVCPNCTHLMQPPRSPDPNDAGEALGSTAGAAAADRGASVPHGGDRILVLKYLYEFSSPRRWDVVVFRFPGKPKENYIKRLIGLPGEHIMVLDGDVYASVDGVKWNIARKLHDAPAAQEALWSLVHSADFPPIDGDYHAPSVHVVKRWDGADPAWKSLNTPVFEFSSTDGRLHSARYVQYLNKAFRPAGGTALVNDPRGEPVQISDAHAYNGTINDNRFLSRRVVADLRLSCDVVWKSGDGFFEATLTKLYHQFTARIHADGRAELFHSRTSPRNGDVVPIDAGRLPDKSSGIGPMTAGRKVTVELINVDYTAMLKIDGAVVTEIVYQPPLADGTGRTSEPLDLLNTEMEKVMNRPNWPRVQMAGASAGFEVRHTRIDRDIYYSQLENDSTNIEGHMGGGRGTRNRPIHLSAGKAPGSTREYFVLGDNSNASSDSRFWGDSNAGTLDPSTGPGRTPYYQLGTVPEEYLTGKAFFVYWPSAYSPGNQPWLSWLGIPRAGQWRLIR